MHLIFNLKWTNYLLNVEHANSRPTSSKPLCAHTFPDDRINSCVSIKPLASCSINNINRRTEKDGVLVTLHIHLVEVPSLNIIWHTKYAD